MCLQDSESEFSLGATVTTALSADSRKAYCNVVNNAIIDRFFGFDCCEKMKKLQKICPNEHCSELLNHFGEKEVRYRSKYTMLTTSAPGTYFSFFSSKVPWKIIFTILQNLALVA